MNKLTICSMGLGNNSIAMMIKKVQLKEKVQLITFADTKGEKPETYAYLTIFNKWLKEHSYPKITVVQKVRQDGRTQSLEGNCLESNMLPSIAYGYKSCSLKYKVGPQDKYVNNWQPAKSMWKSGGKVTKLIGIHAGEAHRAKFTEDEKYLYEYPLIEWGMDGTDCKELIKSVGLPIPGKSACFFCPSSKKHEILALPENLQKRAIAIEENAELTTVKGLGRSFSWKNLIKADKEQLKLFDDVVEPDFDCMCMDGEE